MWWFAFLIVLFVVLTAAQLRLRKAAESPIVIRRSGDEATTAAWLDGALEQYKLSPGSDWQIAADLRTREYVYASRRGAEFGLLAQVESQNTTLTFVPLMWQQQKVFGIPLGPKMPAGVNIFKKLRARLL